MKMLINVNEMNEVCGLKDKKYAIETHYRLTNRELVHEVFGYRKFQDDFAENILYVNDGSSFLGSFKPSYEEFVKSIIKTLSLRLPRGCRDNDELTDKLMERVEVLRAIPDTAWLHNEFKELYNTFQEGRKFYKEIELKKTNPMYSEEAKEEEKYFYSCGLRATGARGGFDGFVPVQVEALTRFVKRRKKYKELTNRYTYDEFIKENYDIDKLAMYMAYKYITFCEQSPDNRRTLGSYAKLLDKYFESKYNKKVTIKVDGRVITYNEILERANALNKRIEKIDGEVSWVIVPEGKRPKSARRIIDSPPHVLTLEELENLRHAGEAKDDFYDKNKPLLKAYGRLKYKGYIAYIYPNGEVLLDTVYDERRPQGATGNAIYHIPARYFDMVSGLDKQALMRHPSAKKIVHAGDWQGRAQKVIDQEGTQEEQEQAKQLVKRIIEDNERNS